VGVVVPEIYFYGVVGGSAPSAGGVADTEENAPPHMPNLVALQVRSHGRHKNLGDARARMLATATRSRVSIRIRSISDKAGGGVVDSVKMFLSSSLINSLSLACPVHVQCVSNLLHWFYERTNEQINELITM